jgi:hypothetical protein
MVIEKGGSEMQKLLTAHNAAYGIESPEVCRNIG